MSPLREQILKTVDGYLAGFNTNTAEGLIAHRHPDCKHTIVPTSTQNPVRSNAEYQAMIAPGFQAMKNFRLKIADGWTPLVDEVERKVVLYLTSTAETPIGEYRGEYMFALGMSEDGTQIVDVFEFVDSAMLGDFMPRMIKWMQDNVGDKAE